VLGDALIHIIKYSHARVVVLLVIEWVTCCPRECEPGFANVLRIVVLPTPLGSRVSAIHLKLTYMKLETIFSFRIPWNLMNSVPTLRYEI